MSNSTIWYAVGCVVFVNVLFIMRGAAVKRDKLRYKVFQNLNSAREDGQFAPPDGYLYAMTPAEVAYDLICYAEDCQYEETDVLTPYVKEWFTMWGMKT